LDAVAKRKNPWPCKQQQQLKFE